MMRAPVLALLGHLLLVLPLFGHFASASECEDAEQGTCDLKESKGNTLMQLQAVNEQLKQSKTDMSAEAIAHRRRLRARLLIESDLGALHESTYRAYQADESIEINIDESWNQFVNATDLSDELTSTELELYKERFVEEMLLLVKHNGTSHWLQELQVSFQLEKPVATEALINSINAANLGFTVGLQPYMLNMSKSDLDVKLGRQHGDSESDASFLERGHGLRINKQTPDSFDARTADKFASCEQVTSRVLNQGTCGSCWAFGSLAAMDSRLCIATNGRFQGQISRGYTASCAIDRDGDGTPDNGCGGGISAYTLRLFDPAGGGIPTGGSGGCHPYFGHGDGTQHFGAAEVSPACPTMCGNQGYGTGLHADKIVLDGASSFSMLYKGQHANYIEQAKSKIYESGPLPMGMRVEQSFFSYTSGVWNDDCENHLPSNANHEVVAIGWGDDYILGLNSWGPNGFGMGGSFKFANACATDFTVPADIPASVSIPGSAATTAAPTTAAPTTPAPTPASTMTGAPFTVTGTGCSVEGSCIKSQNYDANSKTLYPIMTECTVTVVPTSGVILEVEDFNTEQDYDKLTVNNIDYSGGGTGLQGKTATGAMTWTSDSSITNTGWKICAKPPAQSSASSASMKTAKGCKCKKSWRLTGYPERCSGCCNPDNDPNGDWCMVKRNQEDCQGLNWGYC